ncbi:MAG: hypothetical protein M0D57_06765 [Sphingobacteriales bacterium JAD_PAG50586_3]|nr:MAG: hypothetical protein M0D57_06765 [Sphingobacteriales bacterium JAD_PAG50586_3]
MKKLYTILLLMLTVAVNAQTVKLKAGSVLTYRVTNGADKYRLTVTIKELEPNLSITYALGDGKIDLGSVTISRDALDNAITLNNDLTGGILSLSTETTLWFSKTVYNGLKRDFQSKLTTKGQTYTLLNNYEDEYKVTVDGKATGLNIIYAEEQSGKPNKYWVLNDETNPLIIKLIDWGVTIELEEIKL